MDSVDQLQQLPESVKRNILARLFTPNVEAVVPVLQVDDAASADDPQQQGLAQQLSSRQISLPQMNGQASVVDGVLSQVEVQVGCQQSLHPPEILLLSFTCMPTYTCMQTCSGTSCLTSTFEPAA